MNEPQYDIAIIGAGPAGSTAANYLARAKFRTCIIERKSFPRETICGEFLSGEVTEILHELDLIKQFQLLRPNTLTAFRYSPEHSRSFRSALLFTAYTMKRGKFDAFLLDNARKAGAVVYQPATVEQLIKNGAQYQIALSIDGKQEQITARYVIGAYGKNSPLDKTLQRDFLGSKSRLNGVKFHVPKRFMQNIPDHEIQIYTAQDMYCGVNAVDEETVTVCFLERHAPGGVPARERIIELIKLNKQFAEIVSGDFETSIESFPFYGTGDIYFGKKNIVENGIFMIGDASRVIAPLAGDGIGMAMQSAKVLASVIEEGRKKVMNDDTLAGIYQAKWNIHFRRRLYIAQRIQTMLLSQFGKKASEALLGGFPSLLSAAIEQTRG
ncbi:MAG: FAD-dependent monooxygenase [Ignavibacteriales bacterium]|nr:FAD-dependent monooxygenase [Ignavibacteriales bacterium]